VAARAHKVRADVPPKPIPVAEPTRLRIGERVIAANRSAGLAASILVRNWREPWCRSLLLEPLPRERACVTGRSCLEGLRGGGDAINSRIGSICFFRYRRLSCVHLASEPMVQLEAVRRAHHEKRKGIVPGKARGFLNTT
jgi:hypothetical protein